MNTRRPEDLPTSTIGLIGLGLMGSAMGELLLACGKAVLGYDIAAPAMAAFRNKGGQLASDPAAVFAACDKVLLSLPSGVQVRMVLQKAAVSFRPGQIVLDTTTGDPASTVTTAGELATRQVVYLDATVSGNSEQLRQGQTLWMVGGPAEAFEQCADLFGILAQRVIHTGPCGTGARMKLVTNLVLGLNRAALAEGLVLAEALGLDSNQTLEVLRASMAYSRVMDVKGRKMIERDFSVQARLSQHLKDVRLMLQAAADAGIKLPLSESHRRLMEHGESHGFGDQDNSVIIEVIRKPGDLENS